ncbi:cilia- and flagella-associated protein 97-like [Periplaneta americana]|uniref:cilia- and flagella-associated protein 97-like n=1 Tax=Periplaneta americana TaxID=6978 RepID=UPI0037E7E61F
MSRNIGSHIFRNSTNGSLIHVDIGLHEDIDYDFFDSGDSHRTITKSNGTSIQNFEPEEKAEGRKSSLKLTPCGDGVDVNSTKVMKISACDIKERNAKGKKESIVQFNSVNIPQNISEVADKNNMKKEKYLNLKELMNCIAYGENNDKIIGNSEDDIEEEEDDDHAFSKSHSPSSDFRSLSTDTTSEITDVTTRPSSSGCSSMSKHESADNIKALEENKPLKSPEKSEQKQDTQEAASIGTSMKLIVDALDSFERKERRSGTSSASSTIQKNGVRRKNMSFTNEECRKIKRENEILIKKLEGLSKLRPKQTVAVNQPRLSSSAINRRKQQAQIERDNMILLKKIEQAKPTTRITSSQIRR